MESLLYALNALLLGIVGFFLASVYGDIKEALKNGAAQHTLIQLLQQAQSNHKATVDMEIGYLKQKLVELGGEIDALNRRLDELEDKKLETVSRPAAVA